MECIDTFPFKRPYPYISFKCYGNMALYILNLYHHNHITKVKYEKKSLFVTFYDYGDTHYVSGKRYFPIISGDTLIGTYDYDTSYIPGQYLAKNMYEVDDLVFELLNMPIIKYSQHEHEYLAKRCYEPTKYIEYTVIETDNSDDSACDDEPASTYFSDTSEED